MGPVATSVVDNDVFIALVEGFAALGTFVTLFSALAAFLALVSRDPIDRIGQAVNYGIAYGFVPGVIIGGAVFYSAVTTL